MPRPHVAALASLLPLAGALVVGPRAKTFGVGLKGISLTNGRVLLNYTVTDGVDYAYLDHFWLTYMTGSDALAMNRTTFDYYLDGESKPSISFNPAYAAGNFFPGPGFKSSDPQRGDGQLYSAGDKMGKGSLQGGWYHHNKIPFARNAVVRVNVRGQVNGTLSYYLGWVQIRGVEGVPIVFGGGIELPKSARMELHAVDSPFKAHSNAVMAWVPKGREALVYLVAWSSIALKETGYIEGQFHAKTSNISGEDLVLGTGVEDYFQSAFRFSADFRDEAPQRYAFGDVGLTYFQRIGKGKDLIEMISAYKFHDASDFLILSDGGQLYWEARGDVKRMRSYVWLYSWPKDKTSQISEH